MGEARYRRLYIAVAVGSAVLLAGAAPITASAAPAGATIYRSATLGFAVGSGASAPGAGQAATNRPRGVRQIPILGAGGSAAGPGRAPLATPSSGPTANVLHNFNGVSSLDSAKTNFGAEFEPPDQALCAGNGFVLEAVNSAYTIYRANGSAVVGPFNVNDLFNDGSEEFTSDPRCYFDQATNTWFALILFINSASTVSRVDLAVNTSGDPTKLWQEYKIDTTDIGRNGEPRHPGCPCLGDQPTLGIDQFNLYFTTNEFSLLGPQFNGAQIYAVSKADLLAGNPLHMVHFDKLSIGGAVATSVQPSLNAGKPNAEYFMNSLDPNGTFDNRLGVWAMTEREAVSQGDSPVLSSTVIGSEAYGLPPKAEQKGSSSLLDSGDDRMQQTQFIGGKLWGELTSAVTIPGDPVERAGAAWFAVRPTVTSDGAVNAVVARQGYVVASGGYVVYPAVQADASGRAAMGVTLTSNDRFPSTAYAVLGEGESQFGSVKISAAGTGPYDPNATRWGDYAWAVLDPVADTVWLANEYVPAKSSQTPDRLRNWGTRVVEVSLT